MADSLSLAALVLARLETLPNLVIFDNEEVDVTPTKPFAIFRDGPDRRYGEFLDGGPRRFEWTFQVVCAGRDQVAMRRCVVDVRNSLGGWRIGDSMINEVENGASDVEDTTIPADVRHSRTLEFRLYTNWS